MHVINHLIILRPFVKHQSTDRTHPKVVAARCQDGLVSVELLLPGDQGDVTQQAILPLLVEGSEDRVLVGL